MILNDFHYKILRLDTALTYRRFATAANTLIAQPSFHKPEGWLALNAKYLLSDGITSVFFHKYLGYGYMLLALSDNEHKVLNGEALYDNWSKQKSYVKDLFEVLLEAQQKTTKATLLQAAKAVIAAWEGSGLAGAVRRLDSVIKEEESNEKNNK